MSKTAIEWTDETWNPTTGCTKISPGCKNCYADTLHTMRHEAHLRGEKVAPTYHTPFTTLVCHPERLDALPLKGKARRVFVNSMSDLFHDDVPDEFLDQVFAAMALRPHMTFQVLTKRPERMRSYFGGYRLSPLCRDLRDNGVIVWPLPNVWLGVSVESNKYRSRIEELLRTPAAVRFLSIEPMLGPVEFADLSGNDNGPFPVIDWVIVGGESGAGARPMHPQWARDARDQCRGAHIAFFFKQWGEWAPGDHSHFVGDRFKSYQSVMLAPDGTCTDVSDGNSIKREPARVLMDRVGCAKAGRVLAGREWNEFPETPR